MYHQLFLVITFLTPLANAGEFTFELSAFCELDRIWCIDQHITEIDSGSNDDYGATIMCGRGRLHNYHTHYDDGDGLMDKNFEIISKVIHDCTTDGQVKLLEFQLTSFDGKASESDQLTVRTSESKHHIRYKIDLIKDSGTLVTGQQTLTEFELKKTQLTE